MVYKGYIFENNVIKMYLHVYFYENKEMIYFPRIGKKY